MTCPWVKATVAIIILFKVNNPTNTSYRDIKLFYFQVKIQQNLLTPIGSYVFEESPSAFQKINPIIYYMEILPDRMHWLTVWNQVKSENDVTRS